jgi:hypothetical protein
MTDQQRLELEAAAFRRLVAHLDSRKDVQNIDLMNLSGFCRNCLSKWYKAAADERQIDVSIDDAREVVYGMPYAEWKAQYQQEASAEQQAAFAKGKPSAPASRAANTLSPIPWLSLPLVMSISLRLSTTAVWKTLPGRTKVRARRWVWRCWKA